MDNGQYSDKVSRAPYRDDGQEQMISNGERFNAAFAERDKK
jgi:hypothetical protein